MTERMGGSDVTRATQTVALRDEAGGYTLHGNKFYTSAIDCDVALALAKCGEDLSLFLVRLPEGWGGGSLGVHSGSLGPGRFTLKVGRGSLSRSMFYD